MRQVTMPSFYSGPAPYKASEALERAILAFAPMHSPTPTAPETYQALCAWYKFSAARRGKFGVVWPVLDTGSDRTIYSANSVNHAFRAWHDFTHVRLERDFTWSNELRVALEHVRMLRAVRPALSADDIRAVWYDTAGQITYYHKNGAYVADQAGFVAACFDIGIRGACSYVW